MATLFCPHSAFRHASVSYPFIYFHSFHFKVELDSFELISFDQNCMLQRISSENEHIGGTFFFCWGDSQMSICFTWLISGSSMCHSSCDWSIALGSSGCVSEPDAAERSVLSCSVQTDEEGWLCKLCPVRDPRIRGTHAAVYLLWGPALLLNSQASTGGLMAFLWRSILLRKLVLLYKEVHGCFLAVDQWCVFRVQLCGDRLGPKPAHLWGGECNYILLAVTPILLTVN